MRLAVALALVLAAPASAAPVELGAVFSTTGAAADYGKSQVRGARLAVAQLNRDGRRFVLRVRDDGSVPQAAGERFAELIEDGAAALLGPTLSGAAAVAHPVAQQRRVPALGVSNTVDGITDVGRWVFRNSLAESVVQPETIRVTRERLGYSRVAIVAATDAYATASRSVFRAALLDQGVAIAADATIASSEDAAIRAAVDEAAAAQPEVLVVAALAPDVAKAMTYARTLPALAGVPFVGGNSFNTPGLAASAGGAAEGAISGAAWIASRRTPGNRAFVAAYRKRFGTAPDQFAAQAYAGVRLIAVAVRREGGSSAGIRRGLAGIRDLRTILGRFSFTADREPVYDPVVVRLAGSGYEPF